MLVYSFCIYRGLFILYINNNILYTILISIPIQNLKRRLRDETH